MSVKVKYKGEQILSLNTDTEKALATEGQYCEADILVENVQDGGITPSGNINITDTNPTDVTNYATATIVDADLVASNIKEGVNILGILGTFAGGGGGGLPKIGTVATNPTEGSYGRIEIPAEDGLFLLTNVSVTPTNANRLPYAMIVYVDTSTPTQQAAVIGFNLLASTISASSGGQEAGICYFNGVSGARFGVSATYDLYKID